MPPGLATTATSNTVIVPAQGGFSADTPPLRRLPHRWIEVKQDHGEVHVIGSGNLVQTLLQHGLIDVLNLWLYPILLGTGKRLFADGTIPTALRLTDSATFAGGAVLLTYERAGKPTYGNLARDADGRPVTAPPTPSP